MKDTLNVRLRAADDQKAKRQAMFIEEVCYMEKEVTLEILLFAFIKAIKDNKKWEVRVCKVAADMRD